MLVPNAEPATGEAFEDAVAFDDALRRAMPRLRRYASRPPCSNQHEAEEVVQEALLARVPAPRAADHRRRPHGLADGRDRTPHHRPVARTRSYHPRSRSSRSRAPGRDTPPTSSSRATRRGFAPRRARGHAGAASLGGCWAREVEGLSYDEIGDRYGLTEPTVRSLLHRARKTPATRITPTAAGTLPSFRTHRARAPLAARPTVCRPGCAMSRRRRGNQRRGKSPRPAS